MHTFLKYICLFCLLLGVSNVSFGQKRKKHTKKAVSKEIASFSFESDKDRSRFEDHFFKAQNHKLDEEWEEEIIELQACLEVTTANSAVYYELAKAYNQLNNVDLAEENYKKALELDVDNIWYMSNLADAYRSKFDYVEELELRKQLRDKHPESDQYRQLYIESLLLLSKHDEAIKEYNILERNYGIQPEYSYKKHQLYIAKKDWKSAERELTLLIEEFPAELDFKFALAEYYIYSKEDSKAKDIYEDILKTSPGNGTAEYGLFQYYFQREDLNSAEKYLKNALRSGDLSRKDQLSIIEYAYSQYTNKVRSAEDLNELLDISIEQYPDQFEFYGYKGDLVPNARYEQKVGYYKKALELNPQFQLYNVIYEIYFYNEAFDSTLTWTQHTINQFSYRPEPYLIQAYSYFRLNQFEKSIESAENGLEFVIDNNTQKIPFLSIIGTSANSLKQYGKSDKAYQAILKIDPENVQTLNNYSYYLAIREENLELAEKMITEVIKKEPNSSTYLDTSGWVKYKLGKYDEALIILQKAIDLTPQPSAEMYEHLGDCYFKLNNKNEAVKAWKKASSLAEGDELNRIQMKIQSNE